MNTDRQTSFDECCDFIIRACDVENEGLEVVKHFREILKRKFLGVE